MYFIPKFFSVEVRSLKDRNAANLKKYYDSKSHQKKPLQSGGYFSNKFN